MQRDNTLQFWSQIHQLEKKKSAIKLCRSWEFVMRAKNDKNFYLSLGVARSKKTRTSSNHKTEGNLISFNNEYFFGENTEKWKWTRKWALVFIRSTLATDFDLAIHLISNRFWIDSLEKRKKSNPIPLFCKAKGERNCPKTGKALQKEYFIKRSCF